MFANHHVDSSVFSVIVVMQRQSILSRPLKSRARANEEHLEVEYQKEVALLEAKQRKYQQTDEYLRKARFGEASTEDKVHMSEEFQKSYAQHEALKAQHEAEQADYDRATAAERLKYAEQAQSVDTARSTKRRDEAREIMIANREMAERKREQRRNVQVAEAGRDASNLQLLASERRNYR